MTDKKAKAAPKKDFKLVEILPKSLRQTKAFQKLQLGFDWLSTAKGSQWGFGALALILAMINFLPSLNNPEHPYWDESYYVTSTARYVEHRASFASHPPLGFMFMAAGASLVGDNRAINTHSVAKVKKVKSEDMPKGYGFTGARLPSALFAVASAVFLYAIMVLLVEDGFMALAMSLMFIFENGFIVQFRAMQLDSYQIGFAIAGIWVWLRLFLDKSRHKARDYSLFGALIGFSFMVKVNSAPLLALGGLSLVRELWLNRARVQIGFSQAKALLGRLFMHFGLMCVSFIVVVLSVFCLHTALNPVKPDLSSEAGKRDWGATHAVYRDFLDHKRGLDPEVLWASMQDYYDYMHHDFTGEIKDEPNGQKVLTWPWLTKVISYRWDSDGKKTAYSLFVGNQVVWRLALGGLILGVGLMIWRRVKKPAWLTGADHDQRFETMEILMAMYGLFMAVHWVLGTQRVMYIYHYFIGLILSFMITAMVIKAFLSLKRVEKHASTILVAIAQGKRAARDPV